jgi:mono/diheme cytochrome c family protein
MRRLAIALAALGLAGLLAGCGAQGTTKALPETVVGTLPKASAQPTAPASKLTGNPSAGKPIFLTAGCKGCHTLADAGATGTVGPNLDSLASQLTLAIVTRQVENGGAVMPAFKGQLTPAQIDAVAKYVTDNAGK